MHLRHMSLAAMASLALVGAAAAQPMHDMPGMNHAAPLPAKSGLATGVIRGLQPDKNTVTIEHTPIDAFGWPGMTMGFKVKSSKLLTGLKVGDKIRFEVEMLDHKAVITKLTPL
ncbi:MAG: copper-binding protein [Pseudomonadota bacterium]|jgi:Cu(I)/Ag(I) efflux system protein CusF